ncbi:DUF5763 domain-containing protein [Streptomyces bacillaris]|uniref:DUF5763 domain-containing protein n=1 Tax=Streptomyces bacillaris TaxID=68179 RepID=UPI0035E0AF57
MRRCSGITRQGRPCGNPAGRNGYCHSHGGAQRRRPRQCPSSTHRSASIASEATRLVVEASVALHELA